MLSLLRMEATSSLILLCYSLLEDISGALSDTNVRISYCCAWYNRIELGINGKLHGRTSFTAWTGKQSGYQMLDYDSISAWAHNAGFQSNYIPSPQKSHHALTDPLPHFQVLSIRRQWIRQNMSTSSWLIHYLGGWSNIDFLWVVWLGPEFAYRYRCCACE